MLEIIKQPSESGRLGDHVNTELCSDGWVEFRAAIAFVKSSGVKHIEESLVVFSRTKRVRISVGIDHGGTTKEGLERLLAALGDKGEIWVFHNRSNTTFHPKIYLFKSEKQARLFVGSGNLTQGGFYTNHEIGLGVLIDLSRTDGRTFLGEVEQILDGWCDSFGGTSVLLTPEVLQRLVVEGYVPTEATARTAAAAAAAARGQRQSNQETDIPLFSSVAVPPPPVVQDRSSSKSIDSEDPQQSTDTSGTGSPLSSSGDHGFVMLLLQGDAGVGQTTRGKSRRSPEIFIPLAARDYSPDFWGWPSSFTEDPAKPGKMDRRNVRMLLEGAVITVNMMTWPLKHDFRLRSESLRSSMNVGDILKIQQHTGNTQASYDVEVIPQGDPRYGEYLALATNRVRSSPKRWGYY